MHLQRYMLRYINFSNAFLKKVEATEVFSQPDGMQLGEGGGFSTEMHQETEMIKLTKIFKVNEMPPFCLAAVRCSCPFLSEY